MEEGVMEDEELEPEHSGVAFGGSSSTLVSDQPLPVQSPPAKKTPPPASSPHAHVVMDTHTREKTPPPASIGSVERRAALPSRGDGMKTGAGKGKGQLKRIPGYQTFRPLVNAKVAANEIYSGNAARAQPQPAGSGVEEGDRKVSLTAIAKNPIVILIVAILAVFGLKKGFVICLLIFGVFFGVIRKRGGAPKLKE
jgi:hypothetical protein